MSKLEGGCLCGSVRYTSNAEPAMTVVCHCKDCQKQTGTAYSILVAVPEESFTVTGDSLKIFRNVGGSGQPVQRHFCNKCGSPIISKVTVIPGKVFIKAGTLDDTSWLQPQMNIWCSSRQPWVTIEENLPKAEKNPELIT